jgi:hypothetical protein
VNDTALRLLPILPGNAVALEQNLSICHMNYMIFMYCCVIIKKSDFLTMEVQPIMMYPYMILPDETLITHSHLMDKNGVKTVEVHFERPTEDGFDTARCSLFACEWIIREGYTDNEIADFERMLHDGVRIFFKYAESGGVQVAKAQIRSGCFKDRSVLLSCYMPSPVRPQSLRLP